MLNAKAGLVYVLSGSLAPTTLSLIICVWLTLSKDRVTRIKFVMLCVKPKVWPPRTGDSDYLLKLGCDCAVSFIFQGVVEGVKKRGGKKKLVKTLTTKSWYLGRVYRMHCKVGNTWIDYQQPIDLLDWLSNMEQGLSWYQNKIGSMWTYDLIDHLMVGLESISYNDLYCRNKFVRVTSNGRTSCQWWMLC